MRKLNLGKDEYVVSVAVALVIASILLGVYYINSFPEPSRHMSISLLDSQKKASEYPSYLVSGVNSTFSVYVNVENHMGTDMDTQVLVKITRDRVMAVPLETVSSTFEFTETVLDGSIVENMVTVSLDEPGNYSVIFELWTDESKSGGFIFSGNFCVLNVQVV